MKVRRFPLLLASLLLASLLLAAGLGARAVAHAQDDPPIFTGTAVVMTPIVSVPDDHAPTAPPPPPPPAPRSAPPGPSATPTPTAAGIVATSTCTPPATPAQACPLDRDAVNGPFQFLANASQQVFRLDLGPDAGLATTVTLLTPRGLELRLSAIQPDADGAARLLATGTTTLTLAPDLTGSVTLRVENRTVTDAATAPYRIEVRQALPPPQAIRATRRDAHGIPIDALENNWNPETAAEIAVGMAYDLTFACPDPRPDACPGGDMDYLRLPVKAGLTYRVSTFDLGPGVDSVLQLFWADVEADPALANDDVVPGAALSSLTWTAPDDGDLVIRAAPRHGARQPVLGADADQARAGHYRLAVTLVGSVPDQQVLERLYAQAPGFAPTPTPAPARGAAGPGAAGPGAAGPGAAGPGAAGSGAAASAPPPTASPVSAASGGDGAASAPAPTSASTSGAGRPGQRPTAQTEAGQAITVRETVLRLDPNAEAPPIATLPPDTVVALRGPSLGLWVQVATVNDVLPGWVLATDLQRTAASLPILPTPVGLPAPVGAPSTSLPSPATSGGTAATDAATARDLASMVAQDGLGSSTTRYRVERAMPVAAPPPPSAAQRVPFTVDVVALHVQGAVIVPPVAGGVATPTPAPRRGVAGLRVQLLTAFDDVLAEAQTGASGRLAITTDILPGTRLWVRIPALGLVVPVDPARPTITLTLREPEHR